jgi:tetratricopeptide (TPR) repeat protein
MYQKNINVLKDFNRICWKESLWLNFLRAVCVLPILIILTAKSGEFGIGFYLSYPFIYNFITVPLLWLMTRLLELVGSMIGVPAMANLFKIVMALGLISGGDPILYLIILALKKIKPDFVLVPIKKYPIICLDFFMIIVKDDSEVDDSYNQTREDLEETNYNQTDKNKEKLSPYLASGMNKTIEGDYNGALVDYNEAIRSDPNEHASYFCRALVYKTLGNYNEAIADLRKCFSLNSQHYQNDPRYYFFVGQCYNMLNNYQEAIKNFDYSLTLDPQYYDSYKDRGSTKLSLGQRYQEAIADFDQCIRMNPNDSQIYAFRALARVCLGDREGSRLDYQKAIQLGNHDSGVKEILRDVAHRLGES